MNNILTVTSPDFGNHGVMQKINTGFGDDRSPAFHIEGLCDEVVSIAIIMDDLDIPFIKAYNHWTLWNVSPVSDIPSGIPKGIVSELGNAMQGVGFGKNCYRGPRQPFFVRSEHKYRFCFYALDCALNLESHARKSDLLNAMSGHILQQGEIVGRYKR